jgi:hypothetical protein
MNHRLIDDWRFLLPRLWSNRMAMASAVAQITGIALDIMAGFEAVPLLLRALLAILGVILSLLGIYARMVMQQDLRAELEVRASEVNANG